MRHLGVDTSGENVSVVLLHSHRSRLKLVLLDLESVYGCSQLLLQWGLVMKPTADARDQWFLRLSFPIAKEFMRQNPNLSFVFATILVVYRPYPNKHYSNFVKESCQELVSH